MNEQNESNYRAELLKQLKRAEKALATAQFNCSNYQLLFFEAGVRHARLKYNQFLGNHK